MFADKLAEMRTIKDLLGRAETIAHELGDEQPGAEHLLLSAVELPDGAARAAFARVDTDADLLSAAVVRQHEAALAAAGIEVPTGVRRPVPGNDKALVSFNDAGRKAFQRSAKLVKEFRPTPFGGAHVVLAICEEEHGPVARTLRVLDVDRLQLAAAARAELTVSR